MGVKNCLLLFLFITFLSISSSTSAYGTKKKQYKPCKQLVMYFHNILYNGKNLENATAAIVAAPAGFNLTTQADKFHFGDLIVFDNPITMDNNLHSIPTGRAQGMYVYDSGSTFSAWFSVSFVFNSTRYQGSINLGGADPVLVKTRDISVVGGTGDFFMHRGIATLMTDASEDPVYFRVKVDVKFYECW